MNEHTAMRTIVFRCEAGPGYGYGHYIRCSAVADALRERSWRAVFAMSHQSGTQPIVIKSGDETLLLSDDRLDDPAMFGDLIPEGVEWAFVDHYALPVSYAESLQPWAAHVGRFEDFPGSRHAVDLVVGVACEGTPETICLTGPQYVALRSSFAAERLAMPGQQKPRGRRIAIGFGAIDGVGLSAPTAEVALSALPGWSVDVTIGAQSASLEPLRALAANDDRIALHVDLANPAPLLARASLAIGAGGMSAYERCVVGLPSIIAAVSDNQRAVVDAIVAAGAAIRIEVGTSYERKLRAAIETLKDAAARDRMADNAWRYCDGGGAARIADVIENRTG